ncbi:MAG: DegT/DnrJ/EryC1/StrS family aminotransferase [Lachnospiraceae bacterium]|nr:DegT/DnrJ/EryC1/StrS family aminotransferase [Lachnospiraceae bacterium]
MKFVDLSYQYEMIKEEVEKKVLEVMRSQQYCMGTEVRGFEETMQEYLGAKYVVGVGNGTDALFIAMKVLGIGVGDEVITTPFSFFATAESIALAGATPVFVDIDSDTYNIDPEKIEEKITDKTKAIIPVHIFGNPCDMDRINKIAQEHGLFVIEDACQAIGATYKGKKIGNLSDISCFSFFLTKNLGAMGDGGMIVTNTEEYAIAARAYSSHGAGKNGLQLLRNNKTYLEAIDIQEDHEKYYHFVIGQNSRLDEIQAAILSVKLRYLDKWIEMRRKNAEYYSNLLDQAMLQHEQEHGRHVYHIFPFRTDKRNELRSKLHENNIETGLHYPVPIHMQIAFKYLNYQEGSLPISENVCKSILSLPVYPGIKEEELDRIIDIIKKEIRLNESI